ncbi:hypothetical protein XELAEV_18042957mg [Xenopus laevis]|uniref:Uncharacterized protein n=1 Tax=Xenopus laevis TaxID=8355 RepID=A0A974C6B8_XENLA|nr:hypothetical protein XELAEV_18042957mg [Xenopus laevis]
MAPNIERDPPQALMYPLNFVTLCQEQKCFHLNLNCWTVTLRDFTFILPSRTECKHLHRSAKYNLSYTQ